MRLDRLKALANHLLSGKTGHKGFIFSRWSIGPRQGEYSCGTAGCAAGELPVLFPEYWEFRYNGLAEWMPTLKHRESYLGGIMNELTEFFELTEHEQVVSLFTPRPMFYAWGNGLSNDATREQVANNILNFCKYIENRDKEIVLRILQEVTPEVQELELPVEELVLS